MTESHTHNRYTHYLEGKYQQLACATNKQRKTIEDEYESQFDDYWGNDEEERTKHFDKQLNKPSIHENLQNLNPNDVMMDFDATSLYLSATWDENSVYPKIETGFASKPHMNKTYVDAFNIQTFNQDGNESAILGMKFDNPPELIFQHLPVKEKVENIEVIRMRIGSINDTFTFRKPLKLVEKWLEFRKEFFIEKTLRHRLSEM